MVLGRIWRRLACSVIEQALEWVARLQGLVVLRWAGIVTLLPISLRFRFENALQQNGVLGHQKPLLELQDLDERLLLDV